MEPLKTPHGRNPSVRGRLWRAVNPERVAEVEKLGNELMHARWVVKTAKAGGSAGHWSPYARQLTTQRQGWARVARCDGPMEHQINRHLVKNMPYT
jgi:hypothetical protein